MEVNMNFTGANIEERTKDELSENANGNGCTTPNGKALSFAHNFLEIVTSKFNI